MMERQPLAPFWLPSWSRPQGAGKGHGTRDGADPERGKAVPGDGGSREGSMAGQKTICLITAVFNDWGPLSRLLGEIEQSFAPLGYAVDVVVANDASTDPLPAQFPGTTERKVVRSITILDLRANVGNQFAVATALSYAAENKKFDAVLMMDADGEDRVADAVTLLDTWEKNPDRVVVGRRAQRSESSAFKFFYMLYRAVFRLLTGRRIAFGNFSVIPAALLPSVVNRPELGHHFSATLLRTRLPILEIPTARGLRYSGQSNMNMPGLVLHALAGFSVFADVMFSRILIAASFIGVLCVIGAVLVTLLRLFTGLAFPNWATTVIGFLALLATQIVVLVLCTGFLLITNRSTTLLASLERAKLLSGVRTIAAGSTNVQAG